MGTPREVDQRVREGAGLSAADAEALERALEHRPDDLDARAGLLGYYQARTAEAHQSGDPAERFARMWASLMGQVSPQEEAWARHALWLAANAPGTPLAAHRFCQFGMRDPAYAELSSAWRRHAAADPPDATLLAHAIGFFWWPNEPFAAELLSTAEKTFPDDARWLRFRHRQRAHELSHQDLLEKLPVSGSILDTSTAGEDEQEAETRTKKRLADIERLLQEGDPEAEWVPHLREIAGQTAFALGELDRARAHAEQMLVGNVGEVAETRGDAAHNGHMLLGRIALRSDDVDRARVHMILAGEAGVTGMVPLVRPDMRLARDLLARGELDVVIRYLTLCQALRERVPVDDWIAEIRAGRIPDLGRT
jgi:hypothetical protein